MSLLEDLVIYFSSCQWRIIAPKDKIIKVEFKDFNISTDGGNCSDFIAVYNGMSQDKNLKGWIAFVIITYGKAMDMFKNEQQMMVSNVFVCESTSICLK